MIDTIYAGLMADGRKCYVHKNGKWYATPLEKGQGSVEVECDFPGSREVERITTIEELVSASPEVQAEAIKGANTVRLARQRQAMIAILAKVNGVSLPTATGSTTEAVKVDTDCTSV